MSPDPKDSLSDEIERSLEGINLQDLDTQEPVQERGASHDLKDGVIELQGEHRDAVAAELERRGHDVRRSGG